MASNIVFLTALCLLIAVVGTYGRSRRVIRTTNVNTQYGRWNKTSIPFYIDPNFNSTETGAILNAISSVTADLSNCVTFTQVPSTATVFKLKFTALTGAAGSQPQSYCYAYPGVNLAMQKTGIEQPVSLARGPTGCWDGTVHSLAKYIAITLGKRNEAQRGDRNTYITINNANVGVASAFTPYTSTDAYWSLFAYDLCSITHYQPGEFSTSFTSATPCFSVNAAAGPPGFVPKSDHLSLTDCTLISLMYSCPTANCKQTPCAQVTSTPPSTTTNTASTSPPSTTTNTASTTTNTASTTTNTASTTTGTTASTTTNTASTSSTTSSSTTT